MVFNMSTSLEGAEGGQTYYVAVLAVNAVGEGSVSTYVFTVTGEKMIVTVFMLINFVSFILLQFQHNPVLHIQLAHLRVLYLTLQQLQSICIPLNHIQQ